MRFSIFLSLILLLNFSLGFSQIQPDASSKTDDYLTVKDYDQILSNVNNEVSISGQVDEYKSSWSPSAPNIIFLRDGEKSIEVVYWTNNGEKVYGDFTKIDTPIYATGIAQNYRGKLQVKIDDNAKLSNTPLTEQARTAKATSVEKTETTTKTEKKQRWVPYEEKQAIKSLDTDGYTMVYFRASSSPLCKKFETDYLLHPKAQEMISTDTMYFVNTESLDGAALAKELDVKTCPCILILKPNFRRDLFVYKENTTGMQVAEFLSKLSGK
jgi:hypothetical protein